MKLNIREFDVRVFENFPVNCQERNIHDTGFRYDELVGRISMKFSG